MKQLRIVLILVLVGLGVTLTLGMIYIIKNGMNTDHFFEISGEHSLMGKCNLVRETKVDASEIENISIVCKDSSDIHFYESSDSEIMVREYMNKELGEDQLSKIETFDKTFSVKGVQRGNGFFMGYRGYIEVYLPSKNWESIKATTVSGDIVIQNVTTKQAAFHSVSGDVELENVLSEEITADAVSGEIEAIGITGATKANTVSGDIDIEFAEINGDVDIDTTSGEVEILVPQGANFSFKVTTVSGDIDTTMDKGAVLNRNKTKVEGYYGEESENKITIGTISGDASIQQPW